MSKRNLGDLGENLLRVWCSEIGIDATPPEKDRNGWDFLLEFPREHEDSVPLDHQASRLRCWVQVKSTDKQNKTIRVKLSNWINLAKDNFEPAFFLICEFDKQTNCQRAFLVHIGESYIRRVLMELRKLGAKNHQRANQVRLPIVYNEKDRLSTLDGNGLAEAIKKHVESMENYILWKRNLIEKLGYEDGGRVMNVTFELPDNRQIDPIDHFVNLSLGIIPHVETTRVEINDMRFGIEAPELTRVFDQKGFLEVVDLKPDEHGALVFYTEDFSKEVRLEADIYAPKGFAPELIDGHIKVRYATPFCDLIISENEGKFNIRWPDVNKQFKLKELFLVAQLFLLLKKAKDEQLNIVSEVTFRDKKLKGSGISSDFKFEYSDEMAQQAHLIEAAWGIGKHFDVQETLLVSVAELLQQNLLVIVSRILCREKMSFQAKYWLGNTETHESRDIFIPHVFHIVLGEYVMCFLVAASGRSRMSSKKFEDANEWRFYTEDVDLIETRLLVRKEVEKFEDITRYLLNLGIAKSPEQAVVILPDDAKELLNSSKKP